MTIFYVNINILIFLPVSGYGGYKQQSYGGYSDPYGPPKEYKKPYGKYCRLIIKESAKLW